MQPSPTGGGWVAEVNMARILFKLILYIILAALLLRAVAIVTVVMTIWAVYWVVAE